MLLPAPTIPMTLRKEGVRGCKTGHFARNSQDYDVVGGINRWFGGGRLENARSLQGYPVGHRGTSQIERKGSPYSLESCLICLRVPEELVNQRESQVCSRSTNERGGECPRRAVHGLFIYTATRAPLNVAAYPLYCRVSSEGVLPGSTFVFGIQCDDHCGRLLFRFVRCVISR